MNKNQLKQLIREAITEAFGEKITPFGVPLTIKGEDIGHQHDVIVMIDSDNPSLQSAKAKINVNIGSFDTMTVHVTITTEN